MCNLYLFLILLPRGRLLRFLFVSCVYRQGLDEADEEKKMENLYTGQGVGVEEDGDDDEDEVDGNVSRVAPLGW